MYNLFLALSFLVFAFAILDFEIKKISKSILFRISVAYLLITAALIYTASIVSCFSLLYNKYVYLLVFSLIILFYNIVLRLSKIAPVNLAIKLKTSGYTLFTKFSFVFFLLLGAGSLFIAIHSFPEHGDAASYKLPRLYYYIADGNLLPKVFHDGPRVYGPLNAALLQLPLVLFNLPINSFFLLNYMHWILLGMVLFFISYLITEKIEASLLSVLLFLVSGVTFYQSASDGDDLLSSVPAVFGVLFFLLWIKENRYLYASLAGLGIGISFGAKFFPVFYFPIFILLLFYLLWKRDLSYFKLDRIYHYLIFGISFLSVTLTYFAASYIAFGSFSYPNYDSKYLLNIPFSYALVIHNIVVHNTSLFFSFIPELFPTENPHAWNIIHNNVQSFFERYFWPSLAEGDMVNSYKRTLSWDGFYTNKEFFGTYGLLVLLNLIFLFSLRKRKKSSAIWMAILFITWNLFYSIVHRYLADCGRYWILPVSLCVPFVAVGIDEYLIRANRNYFKQGLLILAIIPVFPFAWMQMNTDYHRNIIRLIVSEVDYRRVYKFPYDLELAELKSLNMLRSYYNFPFYEILQHTKNLREITISGELHPEKENVIVINSNYIKNKDSSAYPIFLPFKLHPNEHGTFRFCYERSAGYLFVHSLKRTSCETNGEWEIFTANSLRENGKISLKLWNDFNHSIAIKIRILSYKNSAINFESNFVNYSHNMMLSGIPEDSDFVVFEILKNGKLSILKYPMNPEDRFFLQDSKI